MKLFDNKLDNSFKSQNYSFKIYQIAYSFNWGLLSVNTVTMNEALSLIPWDTYLTRNDLMKHAWYTYDNHEWF